MAKERNILSISRELRNNVGESISFGSSVEFWESKGLQQVGELRAVVEMVQFKFSDDIRVRITGKGIDALWCPFSQRITGKGSKKFMYELSEVGRDAVAWFTSSLEDEEEPNTEPEPEPLQEEEGTPIVALNCPCCNTVNAFPQEYAHRKVCSFCEANLHMIDGEIYHYTPKNKGVLSKEDLERVADGQTIRISTSVGNFIYDPEYRTFADMDGKEARRYLESRGFVVVDNGDTGHNGYARTECGINLSTNGFLTRVQL